MAHVCLVQVGGRGGSEGGGAGGGGGTPWPTCAWCRGEDEGVRKAKGKKQSHRSLTCFHCHASCCCFRCCCLARSLNLHAQILAVAVSAVTDLWTRQAFSKAEQLQQPSVTVTVNQECDAVLADQGAVKRAAPTYRRFFSSQGRSSREDGGLQTSKPGRCQ